MGSLLKKGHKKMDEKKVREAIEELKDDINVYESMIRDNKSVTSLCARLKAKIENLTIAIEALEKQLPKKPKEMKYELLIEYGWKYACPTCGCACGENMYHYDVTKDDMFCTQCGQLLDWSE